MSDNGVLVIISGPSGVGKTSVRHAVLAADANTCFSVSATTRQPRDGEKNGEDYFFISQEEFDQRKDRGEFLETATVFDHSYGTLTEQVEERLRAGKNVILDIDTKGAEQIRSLTRHDLVSIFILPPSAIELRRRIIDRNTEQGEALKQRIARAEAEMAMAGFYDYRVVNDDIQNCVKRILGIIREARSRVNKEAHRVKPPNDQ